MDEKKFDFKTILVIAICLVIFYYWQGHLKKKNAEYEEYVKSQNQQSIEKPTEFAENNTTIKKEEKPIIKEKKKSLDNKISNFEEKEFKHKINNYEIVFSSINASIKKFTLTDYKIKDNNVVIIDENNPENYLYNISCDILDEYKLVSFSEYEFIFKNRNCTKKYNFEKDKYLFKISFENPEIDTPKVYLTSHEIKVDSSIFKPANISNIRSLAYNWGNKIESILFTSLDPLKENEKKPLVKWVSLGDHYFMGSLIIPNEGISRLQLKKENDLITAIVEVQKNKNIMLFAYLGPKEYSHLKKVNEAIGSDIKYENNLDFGWLSILAIPMLAILKFFYSLIPNWGISIILLTILIKIILYPLAIKSFKSMKDMQKIQPEMNMIRQKYKDDKEKLNKEIMLVMKRNKVNPMGSCLPILLQMPVFFALYRVFSSSVELYKSSFCLWITDLSVMDKFWVLPIIMTGFMVLQQKLTPTTMTDPVQQKMMLFMPVIFGLIMINLPAGLNLYFLVNTVFSLLQQLYMQKGFKLGFLKTEKSNK